MKTAARLVLLMAGLALFAWCKCGLLTLPCVMFFIVPV